ncbi:MAG: DegV family protein [Anaerolineaceae bacterium]|mgnify:CR=1 FL=1|nr:DegV family protein [Anaerolineaceae bacterium]
MSKVVIVTDSTAYLPQTYVDELGIEVVPLTLNWDGQTYRDGIDIQPDEFYTRLSTSNTFPTTSQATIQDFSTVFQKVLDRGDSILTMPISSGISGTVYSAFKAKEMFKDAPIEVIDTRLVSMALSFQVLAAARAAKDGASLEECKQVALEAYKHIGVYFVVDSLRYLHAGGRIGGGKRFLGTALKIKPVLEIREGKIEAVKSAITMGKAIEAMIDLVKHDIQGKTPVRISVFHALAEKKAQALLERMVTECNAVEGILSYVSPVVGCHVGPGTLSIAYMAGM